MQKTKYFTCVYHTVLLLFQELSDQIQDIT